MLQPEEVDEGYFTPIASTTLASIFRDNSKNEESVNTTLKYKAPQLKKPEHYPKSDDPNATQLVYSCSLVAYEWVNGVNKHKYKAGFVIIRTTNTGECKIILYTPDKSTLSCTSVFAHLEITRKGNIISLYDDNKKYWGLCFNDKTIDEVIKHLHNENVIINHYETVESSLFNNDAMKQEVENIESEDISDETDRSSAAEDNVSTSNIERANILSRIANVGHAILPSTSTIPASPTKKLNVIDSLNTKEALNSTERLNTLSDVSKSKNLNVVADDTPTKSVAVQASSNNTEHDMVLGNYKQPGSQNPAANVPLVNNQVFTYVNGCMVPVHLPVVNKPECGITSADIESIVQKLTHLQGYVRTMEIMKVNTDLKHVEKNQTCSCKDPVNDDISTNSNFNAQSEEILKKISGLEELIKEKNELISKLHNEVNSETQQSIDNKLGNTIPQSEANDLISSMVKKLMNDTYLSLANILVDDASYSGSHVKSILATVIKKCTIKSLSELTTIATHSTD